MISAFANFTDVIRLVKSDWLKLIFTNHQKNLGSLLLVNGKVNFLSPIEGFWGTIEKNETSERKE
jgi:hypothetical protein